MSSPTLVSICRRCWALGEGFYMPAEEAGQGCPMEHDGRAPKMVKRRLYICDIANHCEEVYGFLTLEELREHQADAAGE